MCALWLRLVLFLVLIFNYCSVCVASLSVSSVESSRRVYSFHPLSDNSYFAAVCPSSSSAFIQSTLFPNQTVCSSESSTSSSNGFINDGRAMQRYTFQLLKHELPNMHNRCLNSGKIEIDLRNTLV